MVFLTILPSKLSPCSTRSAGRMAVEVGQRLGWDAFDLICLGGTMFLRD